MACSCSRCSSVFEPPPLETCRSLEHRPVEGPSDDGCRLRHALRLPDTVQPRCDHLGKRRRHGESDDFRSVSESPRQLFEEEWHAVGTLHERVADLRLQLCHLREPLEHPTRLVAAQPVECDLRVRLDVQVVGDLGSGAHQHQHR